jgi:hypothetical protein
MKLVRAATTLALLAIPTFAYLARPAHAQMPDLNLIPEIRSKSPEEKEADAQRDKAYKESLKKIPDAKTSNDPWGGVRSDAPKTTAAPASKTTAASKKPKTGNSAN